MSEHFEFTCEKCGMRVGGCRCMEGHHKKIPNGLCERCQKMLKAVGQEIPFDKLLDHLKIKALEAERDHLLSDKTRLANEISDLQLFSGKKFAALERELEAGKEYSRTLADKGVELEREKAGLEERLATAHKVFGADCDGLGNTIKSLEAELERVRKINLEDPLHCIVPGAQTEIEKMYLQTKLRLSEAVSVLKLLLKERPFSQAGLEEEREARMEATDFIKFPANQSIVKKEDKNGLCCQMRLVDLF